MDWFVYILWRSLAGAAKCINMGTRYLQHKTSMNRPILLIAIILAAAWFLTPRDIARMLMRAGVNETFRQLFHPHHR